MTRRIITAVTRTLRPGPAGPHVHFHQGPRHHPEVCFDVRCSRPHLDVD